MITIKDIPSSEHILYVGLLDDIQKDLLNGELYTDDSYFYPIQDADDNWIISTQEIDMCTNINTMWVKDLPLILYNPKPLPPLT